MEPSSLTLPSEDAEASQYDQLSEIAKANAILWDWLYVIQLYRILPSSCAVSSSLNPQADDAPSSRTWDFAGVEAYDQWPSSKRLSFEYDMTSYHN